MEAVGLFFSFFLIFIDWGILCVFCALNVENFLFKYFSILSIDDVALNEAWLFLSVVVLFNNTLKSIFLLFDGIRYVDMSFDT